MNCLASKRLVTAALVLLAALNIMLLGILFWQNSCGRLPLSGRGQFNQQNSFIEPLSLSSSQTATFRKLRQDHFLKVRPEMEGITLLKKQLIEVSLQEKPDAKKIEELSGSIGIHQVAIERELALHFHELAKVCTPEQRDSLKQMLDRMATHKHAMRMGHRP